VSCSPRSGSRSGPAAAARTRRSGGGSTHFAAAEAEEFLRGASASEENFARAGQIAAEHCRPVTDQRGPAAYKRHLAAELTVRALRRAAGRVRHEGA
jgi:carbon-monoxide dehydrogenase medium subunit